MSLFLDSLSLMNFKIKEESCYLLTIIQLLDIKEKWVVYRLFEAQIKLAVNFSHLLLCK